MAFCFWFLSMDLGGLILRQNSLDSEAANWISVLVGAVTIAIGYALDRFWQQRHAPRGEDFAFWCYLFGLMAFWGGLTTMDAGSEWRRLVYLLINFGLVALALKLKRTVFMVFGVFGIYAYLGHLAWQVFKDSVFFPFVVALLGLSLILGTVWGQQYLRKRMKTESEA
jgi:arginine exporter protein ArgO